MTEQISELKQRQIVARKRDRRCCYDPQAKRELIEACFLPIVGWQYRSAICCNASAIYPGSAGQRRSRRLRWWPGCPMAFGWNGQDCRLSYTYPQAHLCQVAIAPDQNSTRTGGQI